MNKGFWAAGHRPTLFAAFLYFDLALVPQRFKAGIGVMARLVNGRRRATWEAALAGARI